jgi:two-component system phosphate regulon sensor histidine kinase PhoR
VRWFFWAAGLLSIWNYAQGDLSAGALVGLLLYLGLNIALIPILSRASFNLRRYLAVSLLVIDLLFTSFLIYHTGGLLSQLFLLYFLLVFKAAIYYPYVHSVIFVSFLIFPLYMGTIYLSTGTLFFLQDQLFESRYALLLLVIFGGVYTAWHLDSRHQDTRNLLERLAVEHRHVEERRRELRAVLDSIVDGVIVVDPELRLLMVNPVAADIFNLSYPQPPGPILSELIDNAPLLQLLHQALEDVGGREILIEKEIKAHPVSSGKPILCQALATALVGSQDRPYGAIVTLRDMTRQKELEEAKTNFISVLSHELRTPLTAIRGFVDLILTGDAGDLTPKQHEYLNIVYEQSEQLKGLINALLEFAEMDASETSLQLELVSPQKLVYKVLGKVEPFADQQSVTLQADVPSNLPPLFADGQRLQRVLFSLLDNAIKFTPQQGQVTVTVSDRDDDILICVTDTGSGVPAAEQKRIFERFYQIDNSSTRAHGGTGLGLALCKHIVELHRGRIWVEPANEPAAGDSGPGSRFCFTIPRDLAQQVDLMEEAVPEGKSIGV